MIERETCKCEPCPFDIRTLGYPTCKEDPAFEGTHCLWHEQIRGSKGCIYPSGGTEDDPLFAIDNDGFPIEFGLKELPFYAKKIGAKRK